MWQDQRATTPLRDEESGQLPVAQPKGQDF